MSEQRLLLLSNSRNYGGSFLEHAVPSIRSFLGEGIGTVLFVPYAGVTIDWDSYTEMVRERFEEMGYALRSIHETEDAARSVADAEAIAVGGGNTFRLFHELQERELFEAIRSHVGAGVPYIGWSAGSNAACPNLRTTNDMPIIEPRSFDGLDLIPFQINPHYLDAHPDKHQGETREQRIEEFIEINPNAHVVGLREGSILRIEASSIALLGEKRMRVFKKGTIPVELDAGDEMGFLLE